MRKVSLTLPSSSNFTILITQMGGLGDVVLSSRLIASLRANFPEATLVYVCQAAFSSVCGLFPILPDRVIGLNFSPYDWEVASEKLYEALIPVAESFQGLAAGLFIASEFKPTWFNWYLAAQLKPQRAIQATRFARPKVILPGVMEHFVLGRVELEGPKCAPDLQEPDRYAEIIRYLGGKPADNPSWRYPEDLERGIQETLGKFGFSSGEYLVCFPLGVPGVPEKRWPKERFLEVLANVRQRNPIPVLFIGHTSERGALAGFARELGGRVQLLTTGSQEISLLAGLILHARAYLGNDTGPMHIASAYGVGGVAIYGGGHWPAYGPWGRGSIALVHPLPCFHCDWDCLFGHGVCVESIPVAPVAAALERVLAGDVDEPETVTLATLPGPALDLIHDANARYREAQKDRGERLHSIVELQRSADTREEGIEEMKLIAAERLHALEAQKAAISQLRTEGDRRIEDVHELTMLLDIRDVQIEELERSVREGHTAAERLTASYAELSRQAELRAEGLVQLTAHIAARDARIAEAEQQAQDRLNALLITAEALERERTNAEERLSALLATDKALRITQADSERRLQAIQELTEIVRIRDVRIQELEAMTAGLLKTLEGPPTGSASDPSTAGLPSADPEGHTDMDGGTPVGLEEPGPPADPIGPARAGRDSNGGTPSALIDPAAPSGQIVRINTSRTSEGGTAPALRKFNASANLTAACALMEPAAPYGGAAPAITKSNFSGGRTAVAEPMQSIEGTRTAPERPPESADCATPDEATRSGTSPTLAKPAAPNGRNGSAEAASLLKCEPRAQTAPPQLQQDRESNSMPSGIIVDNGENPFSSLIRLATKYFPFR